MLTSLEHVQSFPIEDPGRKDFHNKTCITCVDMGTQYSILQFFNYVAFIKTKPSITNRFGAH